MPLLSVTLPKLHPGQSEVLQDAKRFNVVVCGRRWGKTFLGQEIACTSAIDKKLVGWFAPNYKYLTESFKSVRNMLSPIVRNSNATENRIELINDGVIEFWTLENPDAGRSRKYDEAIIDEAGLVLELGDRWREAIRATLLDRAGRAWFFGTPKPPTAVRLQDYAFYQFYQRGLREEGDWKSFHRPSGNNPFLSGDEIAAMRVEPGMTQRIARQEIDAEFLSESVDALWTMGLITPHRRIVHPPFVKTVVAIDPATTVGEESDLTGIVVAGRSEDGHLYVINDLTGRYSPLQMARLVVNAAAFYEARIVYETNNGGDYIKHAIQQVGGNLPVLGVFSSGDKRYRAEGVLGNYEMGIVHHMHEFVDMENEMVNWNPYDTKMPSPNRMDALVIALKWLTNSSAIGVKRTNRLRVRG